MGITYTRTSYKLPLNVDADTRIYSTKLECALTNLINQKIQNGIKDDIYFVAPTLEDQNIFIGIILTNNLAVINCYDKANKVFLNELPESCFEGLGKDDIDFVRKNITTLIEEYVKSYNHQRINIDSIQNCKPPLLIEEMRKPLMELSKSINKELAHRHISFDDYPPVPEHFKER